MIIPADIHTHCQPEVPGEAIVNCFPETFVPQLEGWYSVGIHPWYITTSTVSLAEKKRCLEELLYHPQVLAMGEAGLDNWLMLLCLYRGKFSNIRHGWLKKLISRWLFIW